MGYLNASVLNDHQSTLTTSEAFTSDYGVNDLCRDSGPFQNYIDPETFQMLRTANSNRSGIIPVIKDGEITVNQTPGFANIPSNIGESDTYSFVAYDVFSGFRHYPSTHANNNVKNAFYVNDRIQEILKKKADKIEEIQLSVLESRKTQVLGFTDQISQGDGIYNFNTGTDTLEISKAAQKDTMFYNLTKLMKANKLSGGYKIVTSPAGLVSNDVEAMKFREANQKQIMWAQEFMGSQNRYESHQIAPGGNNFNGWLVRDGDIGFIENHPYDFVNSTTVGEKKWSISSTRLQYTNMRANIWVNRDASNTSNLVSPGNNTNGTMSTFEEMAIWTRFYVYYRYNSDLSTRQNGVVKLAGLTS